MATAFATGSPVSVTSSWTTILDVDTTGVNSLSAEVINAGGTALSGFRIMVRPHGSGSFYALFDTSADFATPRMPLEFVSAGLYTLAGGASAVLGLEVFSPERVRFQAITASGTTTITLRGTAK